MKFNHEIVEKNIGLLAIFTVIAISFGSLVEITPLIFQKDTTEPVEGLKPYTALQIEGRDIYVREGCYNCHSQMIRPLRAETERYGHYSVAGESVWDHPFQWGSKRLGPDLHRVGGKYPDAWHVNHMLDPTTMSPGSVMPPYPWMLANDLKTKHTAGKIRAMQKLGVPYPDGYDQQAVADLQTQAEKISAGLEESGIIIEWNKEIIAMTAYLQRLGTDIKTVPTIKE